MGFPWGFSGNNLVKRLCKSLLKKKLGDLILGDIDLDQLDVQISKGTFHLSDLALNAEFINWKLVGSGIMIKEGSMKSLSIRIPLKLKSCEIEVEELELVLAPCALSEIPPSDADCLMSGNDGQEHKVIDAQKIGQETPNYISSAIPRDVDEGVKKIANVVKWFLTSFHIRIKDICVVFDPQTNLEVDKSVCNRSLVLRIKETNFGTCLSEDAVVKLNNFIKFEEAVIEFLQMDDVDRQLHSDLEASTIEKCSGKGTTAILTGPIGGFSGTLNLSIPWKNGSLNLQKIDADVSIDSLELRVQPSSIQWAIDIWNSLKNTTTNQLNHVYKAADASNCGSKLNPCSYSGGSSKLGAGVVPASREDISKSIFATNSQDKIQDTFFTRTNVIQNWIPESFGWEDQTDQDSDYDASIDQFFECFEEMRSSQMNSGNSGIWNWTCSVFNAITFASSLASGSDQIPGEQLVEKTLRAAIAEICVVISFGDEEKNHLDFSNNVLNSFLFGKSSDSFLSCLSSMHVEQSTLNEVSTDNLNMNHLEARFQNVFIDLETYPQNMKFEASVGHIKLDEYYDDGKHAAESGYHFRNPSYDQVVINQHLKKGIQAVLPPFLFPGPDHNLQSYINDSAETAEYTLNPQDGLIKVRLFESFDKCNCQYAVSSKEIDGKPVMSTSINVLVPPIIFWIHFHLVYVLLDLFKLVESSMKRSNTEEFQSGGLSGSHSSSHGGAERSNLTCIETVSAEASLKGNIVFSRARAIVCFPSSFDGDFSRPSSFDKFIIFDHTSSLSSEEVSGISSLPAARSFRDYPCANSTSIHLDLKNFDIYLVESMCHDNLEDRFCSVDRQTFSIANILSVTNRARDHHSGVTMVWQKGPVTGTWMASRAWSLSTSHNKKDTKKVFGEGTGFSSAATSKDLQEMSSTIRRELILSSEFLLHVQFSHASVHLGKKDYMLLNRLLNYVFDGFSNRGATTCENSKAGESTPGDQIAPQTSIFLECGSLDICAKLDEVFEVSHLLQRELEGLWKSFKLSIEKFELLSVSNIGGVSNAKYLWVNHGEGELWGSVYGGNERTDEVAKDFLLIVCRNSAMGRGDGEGTNALSFGAAGTSVTHMWNPKLSESYLSVIVRSGTIVAPGGRLDWISGICLFFSSPSKEKEQSGKDDEESRDSKSGMVCKTSFFLDLVDIALSYEPHIKNTIIGGDAADMEPEYVVEPEEEMDKQSVACLLAAASLGLFNHTEVNSTSTEYRIGLHDVGFLICQSTGSKNVNCGYHVGYLRETGYVKIAQNTLVEALLRFNKDSFWELEISESQFNLDTCSDTTGGLICLIAQLQQLYAPDVQDAIIHLQSRWNSFQQTKEESISSDEVDKFENSSMKSLPASDEGSRSVGLLDEILENAFYIDGGEPVFSDDSTELGDAYASNVQVGNSMAGSEERVQISPEVNSCLSQIIDSYYVPTFLSSSPNEVRKYETCDRVPRDVEGGKSRWYDDSSLMIVDNHMSETNSQLGELVNREDTVGSGSSDPTESSILKGKVLLQNIDVRWRMHAGVDWSTPGSSVGSLSSSGRDGSSCLELYILGLNLQYDMYPDGEVCVSNISLSAQDVNLYDRSREAPWKMVLGCYDSKDYPRESCSKAFRLELEAVRPEPLIPLEDYRLHLEFLPLRLHLDQGQLNFLIQFFSKDSSSDKSQSLAHDLDDSENTGKERISFGCQTIVEEALLPFFQGIDLQLKQVSAVGIYGWSSICETVLGEWLEDISHNQVHKLLKGLAPIRSLFAVGSGTSKLISSPVKSYKEDRKLLKGMQRGAVAFIRSVSIEAVGLGVHLAAGAHEILLKTECILTTIPPHLPSSHLSRRKANIRSNQPEDTQQGIQQQAYESLSDGLGRSASALFGTPLKVYQRGAGARSALASAFRAAPAAAIAPVSASARAVHCALLGLRNSLDPEHKKESMDKYLGPSRS
ncbi:autophagy-related protein 2 isoform X3 [Ananas comosus]|uniref:Autophagy-related protein 2 n=1 Tax=Ananas comosus TaxID=4615 RepID=A0A6P5F5C9_ANACO|nr:autophagy-related protein 2 isoform X3 [Ananas comosus]